MVTREELCRDVLHETKEFDPDFVVKMTLPEMMSRSGNFPMYKYLREAGYLDANGHVKKGGDVSPKLLTRISDTSNLKPSSSIMAKAKALAEEHENLDALIEASEYYDDIITYFGALDHSCIDLASLRKTLLGCEEHFTDENGKLASNFTKAVCIYDLLRYGPRTDWTAS